MMEKQTTCNTCKRIMATGFLMLCFMSSSLAQNLELTLGETWTGTDWENAYQSQNTYDGNDFLVGTIAQVWTIPPGQWDNAIKYTYTNNPAGAATQVIVEFWDEDISDWMLFQRVTNTLNGSNQVLTSLTEMAIGTNWMNVSRQTNTYGGGYLTTSLLETWNFITSEWANSTFTTYTNNPDGSVSQDVTQTWDAGGSVWINFSRSTYTYNGASQNLTALEETWVNDDWQNESRITNTYSGAWLSVSLGESWLVGSGEWQNETQSLYTNNPDGTVAQIVIQDWSFGAPAVVLGAGFWVNAERITFTYGALNVNDLAKNRVVLFPNPASDVVTLKSESGDLNAYAIIDQQGRTVQNGAISDFETSVDISRLSSGVYFFQLGEGRKTSVKLIKQ